MLCVQCDCILGWYFTPHTNYWDLYSVLKGWLWMIQVQDNFGKSCVSQQGWLHWCCRDWVKVQISFLCVTNLDKSHQTAHGSIRLLNHNIGSKPKSPSVRVFSKLFSFCCVVVSTDPDRRASCVNFSPHCWSSCPTAALFTMREASGRRTDIIPVYFLSHLYSINM